MIGDVPWAKVGYDNDIARAVMTMYDTFGIDYMPPVEGQATILGGYWPAYLFAGDPLNIPIIGGAAGSGGNAHAANEFWVIEGAEKVYGMAGAEKSVATVLYNYAGLNGAPRLHATHDRTDGGERRRSCEIHVPRCFACAAPVLAPSRRCESRVAPIARRHAPPSARSSSSAARTHSVFV